MYYVCKKTKQAEKIHSKCFVLVLFLFRPLLPYILFQKKQCHILWSSSFPGAADRLHIFFPLSVSVLLHTLLLNSHYAHILTQRNSNPFRGTYRNIAILFSSLHIRLRHPILLTIQQTQQHTMIEIFFHIFSYRGITHTNRIP